MLPRVIAAYRGGDNHLLTGMGKLLEDDGFRLVGRMRWLRKSWCRKGHSAGYDASERDHATLHLASIICRRAGQFDIGQAVVVAGHHVLAVEAAEGTDAMLGASSRDA